MEQIQPGDNVWLKGQITSPKMTVDKIQNKDEAVCVWFDLDLKHNKQIFQITSLTKENPIKRQ